jgi:hypothetical protein
MRHLGLAMAATAALACNGDKTPKAQAPDPAFDQKWVALAKGGSDPLVIESEVHGAGLMGELRRATDTAPGPMMANATPVTGELPDEQVMRVIRSNLASVKGCYQVAERQGGVGSGKAIVSIEIDPAGTVKTVNIDAPAFRASTLPGCMSTQAKNWTFPKFTQGPKRFSYPFVFVGG